MNSKIPWANHHPVSFEECLQKNFSKGTISHFINFQYPIEHFPNESIDELEVLIQSFFYAQMTPLFCWEWGIKFSDRPYLEKQISYDLHFISSTAPAEDNLQNLETFLSSRPLILKKKWVIFLSPQELGPMFWNKLLKTLEAPPEFGQFVFYTPFNTPLLPAIGSRALHLRAYNVTQHQKLTNIPEINSPENFFQCKKMLEHFKLFEQGQSVHQNIHARNLLLRDFMPSE